MNRFFQYLFSYLQMTEPNLERLVDEYINGEMLTTNLDTKITYQNYNELLTLLSTRSANIQHAMTTILPILHKDVIIPGKISNITRKVRKHIDAGNDVDEVISYLFPPQNNKNEISPFCTQAGISVESLLKEHCINVLSNTPWSVAVKWHQKLFPSDQHDSVTETNINKKWSRNYKKIRHMKVTQSNQLNEYLECQHIPPMKKKSSKEQVLHKLANPPLDQINVAPDPLLAMAEIQGAVMGKYVNKLEQQHLQKAKKIKKLQAQVETLTSQKYKLDEEKRSEDTLVKHLQSKVRKTETALQKEREKVSYLKPRNVK